jgi:hypothetical protein
MTWFFLPSPSVSLVHFGLLFLSFISLLLSFHLKIHDSIALVVLGLPFVAGTLGGLQLSGPQHIKEIGLILLMKSVEKINNTVYILGFEL